LREAASVQLPPPRIVGRAGKWLTPLGRTPASRARNCSGLLLGRMHGGRRDAVARSFHAAMTCDMTAPRDDAQTRRLHLRTAALHFSRRLVRRIGFKPTHSPVAFTLTYRRCEVTCRTCDAADMMQAN
jgi:hypothetical protein